MPLKLFLKTLALQVLRRKWIAVGIFVALVGSATVYLVVAPQKFTAHTTLLAKFGREFGFRGFDSTGLVVPPSLASDDIVGSVTQIMGSRLLVEEVIAKIGVETLYPEYLAHPPKKITPQQAAVLAFTKNLVIAQVKRSNVIEVTFTHTRPELAASALNLFIDAFQEKFLSLYADRSLALFENNLEQLQQNYRNAQAALATFQATNHVFEKDERSITLAQRKSDLEIELARLSDCCAASDSVGLLRTRLDETNAQLTAVQADQNTLADLIHQRDQAQQRVDEARRRLQEARMSQDMDRSGISSISVIDRAEVPAQAQRPSRTIRLIMVAVLAALVGPGIAFLVETARRRFSTAAELATCYAIPVLAEIPRFGAK